MGLWRVFHDLSCFEIPETGKTGPETTYGCALLVCVHVCVHVCVRADALTR